MVVATGVTVAAARTVIASATVTGKDGMADATVSAVTATNVVTVSVAIATRVAIAMAVMAVATSAMRSAISPPARRGAMVSATVNAMAASRVATGRRASSARRKVADSRRSVRLRPPLPAAKRLR